jgi:hypothetical protein
MPGVPEGGKEIEALAQRRKGKTPESMQSKTDFNLELRNS